MLPRNHAGVGPVAFEEEVIKQKKQTMHAKLFLVTALRNAALHKFSTPHQARV